MTEAGSPLPRPYRWLFNAALCLYPRSFRQRFGAAMAADYARVVASHPGGLTRVGAALLEALDLVRARARHRNDRLLPVVASPMDDPMSLRDRISDLAADLRRALRGLLQRPGYSAVIVLTLALGVGASAAIYAVIDAVLLAPMPFPDASRITVLFRADPVRGNANRFLLTTTAYQQWTARSRTLESTAAYGLTSMVVFDGGDWPERIPTVRVDDNFFDLIGVGPELGALPRSADGTDTAVLSHAFWQRALGGDPDVLGSTIRLAGVPHAVVAVMPAGFAFPHYSRVDVWRPLQIEAPVAGPDEAAWLMGIGRLAPGTTVDDAARELNQIAPQVAAEVGEERWTHANVIGLRDMDTSFIRPVLLLLALAAGLLLAIACVNLAGLTVARGLARRREMAVRAAIGASRAALVRLVFLETLLLAAISGALGAVAGAVGLDVLMQAAPAWPRTLATATFEAPHTLFALALALALTLGFGLLPALHLSRPRLGSALREGGAASGESRRTLVLRRMLVATQMALAAVLLVGASLMVRSMLNVISLDLGMEPDGLVTARVGRTGDIDAADDASHAFAMQFLDAARGLPWVEEAAITSASPMGPGADWKRLLIDGEDPSQRMALGAEYRQVTAGYLELLGLRRVQGRMLQASDDGGAPVTVVSQDFVDRFLPGEEPLGKMVQTRTSMGIEEGLRTWEIVGVVAPVREYGATGFITPIMYVPLAQDPPAGMTLVVRTDRDLAELQPELREIAGRIDSTRPVERIVPMRQDLASGNRLHAFVLSLLAGFSTIALVIAAVGLYGTLAQSVGARTREIAVRCALGANPGNIHRMFLSSGALLALGGLAAGLLAAIPVARQMGGMIQNTLLVNVAWWDPLSFVLVPVILAAATLAASLVPARRAAGIEPTTALRSDG